MLFEELCVNANGEIVCSCADPSGNRVFGNVFRDRIADVYDGPGYRAARQWQLDGPRDSTCPVIWTSCGGRVSRATVSDQPHGRVVRLLQLEPVSACNLRCPQCPSTQMRLDPDYRSAPGKVLPLGTMLDVVDQLPHLQKLLFYNFGEPFLHPDAIPFLRELRRRRPAVAVHTSTNGMVLKPAAIEALAGEILVDRIVFSIDGATPESYRRYRVRGSLERALANLSAFADACVRHGTREQIDIVWQYILFEWNDGEEELAEAQRRAAQIGVPLQWIVTHTPGASRVYTDGSEAACRLFSGADPFSGLTCDARVRNLWRHGGVAEGKYAARLRLDRARLEGVAGSHLFAALEVENRSASVWAAAAHRIGARLRDATGRVVAELPRLPLPIEALEPGGRGLALVDLALPEAPFEGDLFLDVVEEGVAWFSKRSSPALAVPVRSRPGPAPARLDAPRLVSRAFQRLLWRPPEDEAMRYWVRQLAAGLPAAELLRELAAAAEREGFSASAIARGREGFIRLLTQAW